MTGHIAKQSVGFTQRRWWRWSCKVISRLPISSCFRYLSNGLGSRRWKTLCGRDRRGVTGSLTIDSLSGATCWDTLVGADKQAPKHKFSRLDYEGAGISTGVKDRDIVVPSITEDGAAREFRNVVTFSATAPHFFTSPIMTVAAVEDAHSVRYAVGKGLEEDVEASWWSILGRSTELAIHSLHFCEIWWFLCGSTVGGSPVLGIPLAKQQHFCTEAFFFNVNHMRSIAWLPL